MTPASTPDGALVCGRPVYRGLGERPTARPGNGGFRDSHHEDTKTRRNPKEELLSFPRLLVSLSPLLPVCFSGPTQGEILARRRCPCGLDTCTTIGGTDTCTTQGRGAQGLTGFFPESGALTCLGWAALAQVLRANRESTPVVLASAAGAAESASESVEFPDVSPCH
jgi:hypothetical protein